MMQSVFMGAVVLMGVVTFLFGAFFGFRQVRKGAWQFVLGGLAVYSVLIFGLILSAETVVVGPFLETVMFLAFYLLPISLGLAIGGAAGGVHNWISRDKESNT